VKKSKKLDTRKLSDTELLQAFDQSLDTLQHLSSTYDNGYAPIAFMMATEVYKILTENSAATRLRSDKRFLSPIDGHGPTVLTPQHKLTIAQIGGDPITLTFLPHFYGADDDLETLDFKKWWNNDIVYCASAAMPGTPQGLIPVNGSPVLPYEKREKVTRLRLTNLLRNKRGAHLNADLPLLLDTLDSSKSWAGDIGVETATGFFSTADGSLKVTVSPIAAMMRQITHELLLAYGRFDPAPSKEVFAP
jgi:hypothetical protein